MASFTTVGDTTTLSLKDRYDQAAVALSGTYSMVIDLQRERGSPGSGSWETLKTWDTDDATVAYTYTAQSENERLRLFLRTDTSGTCTATLTDAANIVLHEVRGPGGQILMRQYQDGITWYDTDGNTIMSVDSSGVLDVTSLKINGVAAANALEVVTTTNVLTAAESGKVLILNSATAFVTTLPAVAADLHFTFICGATGVTGGNHTIVPNASNDNTIFGSAEVAGAVVAADAEGSINMIADKFIAGDWLELWCDGTNWYVRGEVVTTAGLTFTT